MRHFVMTYARKLGLLTILLCFFAVQVKSQQSTPPQKGERRRNALPPINQRSPEIVVHAFTSSTCPWAQRDSFRIALERLVSAARAYGASQPTPMRTVLVGTSIDDAPDVGLGALRRLAAFDEISVGRGWLNAQVIRFGFRDFKHALGTPGIVVYQRSVIPKQLTIEVSPDSVMDRGAGADGILALVRRVETRTGAFAPRPTAAKGRAGGVK